MQIPSNCVGKQLIVRLAPWECLLFDNKTVSCTPAYIEVIKNPAVCTAKYNSSATFTGMPFTFPLPSPSPYLRISFMITDKDSTSNEGRAGVRVAKGPQGGSVGWGNVIKAR